MKFLNLWRKKEQGLAIAVLFVVLMPVMVGMVGYAIDFGRYNVLRSTLQNRADLATQASLTLAETQIVSASGVNQGRIIITPTTLTEAKRIYCANTADYRTRGILADGACNVSYRIIALNGASAATGVPVAQLCDPKAGPRYGIEMVISERINTTFLGIIGIETMAIQNLTSEALFRPGNC
jgi:hypothetical protein